MRSSDAHLASVLAYGADADVELDDRQIYRAPLYDHPNLTTGDQLNLCTEQSKIDGAVTYAIEVGCGAAMIRGDD